MDLDANRIPVHHRAVADGEFWALKTTTHDAAYVFSNYNSFRKHFAKQLQIHR